MKLPLVALAIFALALLPRLLTPTLFPTSDEDSWMRRAGGFAYGLSTGQLGRTYQNGHPGVTTMWTATLSLGPLDAVRFADRVHGLRFVGQLPGYMEGLAQARVGFAVLGALGAAASALLLWRLFGPGPAILAGLGLSLEPFLVANGQLVHVDGPLATFMTVSALAALVRWQAGGNRGYLLLSGVTAGLALLSKSPAVFLLLFVPVLGSAHLLNPCARTIVGATRASPAVPTGGTPATPASPLRGDRLAELGLDLALWLMIALATVVLCWPAIWALGPGEVLGRIVAFTRETGGQPDEVGSFFLGRAGADPGPLYYPLATLFRLSPLAMLGLLALPFVFRALPAPARWRAGWLGLFVVGFALMMTLGPKKFDRYLLPIYPLLLALAALGLWQGLVLLGKRAGARRGQLQGVVALGLLALAVWPLVTVFPYPLSYYSPLLGGGAAAGRAVMVGNGEGLDQAAAWIAAQPGAAESRVAAHSYDILAALVPGQGEPLREGVPGDADYIVTYGRRIQMERWGPSLGRYLRDNPPVHTVRINGIEYARVHPGPRLGRQP